MHEGLQGVLDSTKESTTAEIAHLTAVCKVTTQPSMHASIYVTVLVAGRPLTEQDKHRSVAVSVCSICPFMQVFVCVCTRTCIQVNQGRHVK